MGAAGQPGGARGPRREGPVFIAGKVFLGGISNDTDENSLQAYCGQWGEVSDVHVMHGKGYAFVTFAAVPTAQAFLEHREHYIDGRRVDAKAAVPRDQGGGKLTRKMFVGGIGEVSDAEFRNHFAVYGMITDCVVLRKPDGSSRGFGFVTYDDEMSVEKCLVQEHHLSGRRVDVKRAVNKDDGGGATGGSGGGGGGARGGMPAAGGGPVDKTVDWVCPECGNTNQGWRHTCTRCKTRRANWPGGSGGGSGGSGGPVANPAGAAGGTMQQAAPGLAAMPAGGVLTPAAMMSAGIIPANLMQSMLQNMQAGGMSGVPGMAAMGGMGGMGLPAGMALPMGMMPGMMGMAGMPGMDASVMGAAGLSSALGGMPGMSAMLQGMQGMPGMLNPAAMAAGMQAMQAGTAGGVGSVGGGSTAYGGYGAAAGAGTGVGGAASGNVYGGYGGYGVATDTTYDPIQDGSAYGRSGGGRGGAAGAGTNQRYRPY